MLGSSLTIDFSGDTDPVCFYENSITYACSTCDVSVYSLDQLFSASYSSGYYTTSATDGDTY